MDLRKIQRCDVGWIQVANGSSHS